MKVRLCVVVFAMFFQTHAFAGICTSEIKNDTTGLGKEVDAFRMRAYQRRFEELQSTLSIIDSALEKVIKLNDIQRYIVVIGTKGIIFFDHGYTKEAGALFTEGHNLSIKSNQSKLIYRFANLISVNEMQRGNYDLALHFQLKYLEGMIKIGDPDGKCNANNNLGLIYYKLGDANKALRFFRKALNIKDCVDPENIYLNVGLMLADLGDYNGSRSALDSGYNLCFPSCNRDVEIQYAFNNAQLLLRQNKYLDALRFFEKSRRLSRAAGNTYFEAESSLGIASCGIALRKFNQAIYYLEKAYQVSHQNKLSQVLLITLSRYGDYCTAVGDVRKLSYYQSKRIDLHRAIFHDELHNKIAAFETAFNERENEESIVQHAALIRLNNAVAIIRQSSLYLLMICVILLLLVVIGLLMIGIVRKRMNNRLEKLVQAQTKNLRMDYINSRDNLSMINSEIVSLGTETKLHFTSLAGLANIMSYQKN